MTTAVMLPGLRAHNPLGFLAALGALSLLDDVQRDARLAWHRDGTEWIAALHTPNVGDRDELLAALASAHDRRDLDAELGWASDVRGLDRDHTRALLANHSGTSAERLVGALVTELPPRRDGSSPYTAFRMLSLAGPAKFLTVARAGSTVKPAKLTETLHRALFERWTYEPGAKTLNLDPAARHQNRAVMADAPTNVGTVGMPGSVLLAARGLGFFSLHPVARVSPRQAGWTRQHFVWPVWTNPLTVPVTRLMLAAPRLTEKGDATTAWLHAQGITARYHAERIPMGKGGGRLTWGEPFA